MPPLAVLMFIFSAALLIFGSAVRSGDTSLIRTFEYTKARDKKAYAAFLGRSVSLCALPFAAGGALTCACGAGKGAALLAAGLAACLVFIAKKAKKYY